MTPNLILSCSLVNTNSPQFGGLAWAIEGTDRTKHLYPCAWSEGYCKELFRYSVPWNKDYYTRTRLLAERSGKN